MAIFLVVMLVQLVCVSQRNSWPDLRGELIGRVNIVLSLKFHTSVLGCM